MDMFLKIKTYSIRVHLQLGCVTVLNGNAFNSTQLNTFRPKLIFHETFLTRFIKRRKQLKYDALPRRRRDRVPRMFLYRHSTQNSLQSAASLYVPTISNYYIFKLGLLHLIDSLNIHCGLKQFLFGYKHLTQQLPIGAAQSKATVFELNTRTQHSRIIQTKLLRATQKRVRIVSNDVMINQQCRAKLKNLIDRNQDVLVSEIIFCSVWCRRIDTCGLMCSDARTVSIEQIVR